ncbi:M1 family metallopeptidase [Bacteroidota bacterium]
MKKVFPRIMKEMFKILFPKNLETLGIFLLTSFMIMGCKVNQPVADHEQVVTDTLIEVKKNQADSFEQTNEVYRNSRTRLHDLLHTKLEVSFNWEEQRLEGRATLQLKPFFYPQEQLILDAKNFNIHHIKLIDGNESNDLKYFYDNKYLFIILDTTYTKDESYWLEIDYTAKPAEREITSGSAITSDQGLYFINHDGSDPNKPMQIWTQGETESNSAWFPTIDSPNEQCTQEIYITVDHRFKTLSNGELVYSLFNSDSTRTDYWKQDIPHAPYLFMMAVGEYEIIEDLWNDIPVNYYVEPEYAPYARDIFGDTPEMLEYFSELLGVNYPWAKYSQVVVRDYVSGAMENSSASVFMEDLQVDRRELLDHNWDNIIAHELFHQWFGDLVTCESWSNLTLNEAFANYSEYLWQEKKHGRYDADMHGMDEMEQYLAEAVEKQVDLVRFHYDHQDEMFDNHSYAKGGRILHMLRNYVGDEAFFATLKYYLDKHRHQPVEVHDLRLAFERITGEDLNWYFNQWFLASGHPVIEVEDYFNDGIIRLEVKQLQDLANTPLYKLPLYVDIYTGGEKERYHIIVDEEYQVFEFEAHQAPDLIIFDSEHQLLAEISHEKSLQQLVYQFNHTNMFHPRYEALDSLTQMPVDSLNYSVLKTALHDDFWYFRQLAVYAFDGYEGPFLDEVSHVISKIARDDPKSLVRAEAIGILNELGGDRFVNIYKKALYDSSYSVVGNALFAYYESDPGGFRDIVNEFIIYDNFNIVIPLASYFIDHNETSRYKWFVEKLNKQDMEGMYYLLQYFGEFLMQAPELMKRRGLVVLENYARNNNSKSVRLSAYHSIGLLSDLSGVDELRADIRENEEDKFLREIYTTMQ